MTDLNLLNLIPRGRELVLKRTGDGPSWEATIRSTTAGLSGGSCREYAAKGLTPEKAIIAVLDLIGGVRDGARRG